MVVFYVGWNRGDVLKKREVKMTKSVISGQFPRLVPVPNRGGTSTTHQNMNGTSTDAVPLFLTALVSCIFTLLSPNSYTDSIGTLINE